MSDKKKKCNTKNNSSKSEDNSLGLASLSYADYVILASALAFSLAEDLNDDDLAILITFGYLVLANLEILVAKKSLEQTSNTNNELNDEEEIDIIGDVTVTGRNAKHSKRKSRKIRRKKNRDSK